MFGVSCSKLPPLIEAMLLLTEPPPAYALSATAVVTLPLDAPTAMAIVWPSASVTLTALPVTGALRLTV